MGIGPGAVVEPDARIGKDVAVGANCYIGSGASLGDGSVLFPNVFVGDGVIIGEQSRLYPNVTIYSDCRIGRRVVIHAGTVIGADGFGYAPGESGLRKLPHVGSVEICDDVEIGANSAVDRAKVGATLIGRGTKIDNLVHVAHNVKIGRNCVIVALSGVAGSVQIGDNVTRSADRGKRPCENWGRLHCGGKRWGDWEPCSRHDGFGFPRQRPQGRNARAGGTPQAA